MSAPAIWFWQRIVSPHMAGLAVALAASGREVVYVAEQTMSADRAAQGWLPPPLGPVRLELAQQGDEMQALAAMAPSNSIHITQGLRGNGLVAGAQKVLGKRALRQWIIMETVEDSGWRGVLKRMEYRRLLSQNGQQLEGVLAIGHSTPTWLVSRGAAADMLYPFAYFLTDPETATATANTSVASDIAGRYRFIFVGQLIELKRVDLLMEALRDLGDGAFELAIVGAGPMEAELRAKAERELPGKVTWMGRRAMPAAQREIARSDCLVLPSRHDGWGAVVSESLINGTPVLCSDACGAAGAVLASGMGGVFASGDRKALTRLAKQLLHSGKPSHAQRAALAQWGRSLGAAAGAEYLEQIFTHKAVGSPKPRPPWELK